MWSQLIDPREESCGPLISFALGKHRSERKQRLGVTTCSLFDHVRSLIGLCGSICTVGYVNKREGQLWVIRLRLSRTSKMLSGTHKVAGITVQRTQSVVG